MTTSRDIARVAGVSQATVSRVLRNHPNVSSNTRSRVLKALKKLDYAPNGLARAMITNKTSTIGVVVEDITNPFYPEIIEILYAKLTERGFRVMLWNSVQSGESGAIEAIREKLIDGVVFTTATPDSAVLGEAVRLGSPLVLVNRYVERIKCDQVTTNNIAGGRRVATYLKNWGHKRIAFISGIAKASTSIDRQEGLRRGLEDYGLTLLPNMCEVGGFTFGGSYAAMSRLLSLHQPPTAVFCANDLMAIGAINSALDKGFEIPNDLWVIGFDNIAASSWSSLSITTVNQPKEEMVKEAIRLLLSRIENPNRETQHLRLGGSDLIIRRSTGNNAEIE